MSGSISKEGSLFIFKFKDFTPGVRIWSSKLIEKIKVFPKVKIYTNHLN